MLAEGVLLERLGAETLERDGVLLERLGVETLDRDGVLRGVLTELRLEDEGGVYVGRLGVETRGSGVRVGAGV